MKSIVWIVTEMVNGNTFEHRILYEKNNIWGHENLPHILPSKIMASAAGGSFQQIDKDGDLRQYTWRMENV